MNDVCQVHLKKKSFLFNLCASVKKVTSQPVQGLTMQLRGRAVVTKVRNTQNVDTCDEVKLTLKVVAPSRHLKTVYSTIVITQYSY